MSLGRSRRLWPTELGTLNSSMVAVTAVTAVTADRGLSQRGVQSKNFNRSIAFLLHISFLLRVGSCGLLRL